MLFPLYVLKTHGEQPNKCVLNFTNNHGDNYNCEARLIDEQLTGKSMSNSSKVSQACRETEIHIFCKEQNW